MADTLVVVPTYNASQTIIPLLQDILSQTKRADILVVDDNSPDKTGDKIRKTFVKEKRVKVLFREKKAGRGSAVIAGFQKGLKTSAYRYFIEMDADYCHDPKYIKDLINACTNADVVIASRYIKGAKIKKWKIKRRIISRVANTVLKIILQMPITDYTNGYRCYTRKALQSINLNLVQAKGFIVLSEKAYRLYQKGNKFSEIPITFIDYGKNTSNLNLSEAKEGLYTLSKLYFSY